MRNERLNYVLVGAFVLIVGAALVLWIALMTGRTGAMDPYHIVYRSVAGLKTGVSILYQGYPVGFIDEIEPIDRDGQRMYRVEVSVQEGWPIPVDSEARIATGLFSAPVIDIRGGESLELLEPGGEIPAREAADVFAAVNDVAAGVQSILENQLEPLLDEVSEDVPEITANLETFSSDLNAAMARVNEILAPDNVNRVSSILNNLDEVSADFAGLVRDLGDTRRQLDQVIQRVDGLLASEGGEVGQAVADLNYALSAIARHIDAITDNLEVTTRNMNEFSQQIREDPSILLRGRETGDGA